MQPDITFGDYWNLAAEARRKLVELGGRRGSAGAARSLLAKYQPRLAAELHDSLVLHWLRGSRAVASKVRDWPAVADVVFNPFPRAEDGPRGSLYPQVLKALDWLKTRVPVSPAEYHRLDDDAKRVAFTVARVQTADAAEAVRDAVHADVRDGGSLKEFRGRVAEALEGSTLGESHVETLYRTHVGRAYSSGAVAVLESPAVRSAFPYRRYSATHDSRVRPDHLALETLGLNGTAVYRADDPIWDLYYPPWAWQCRCVVIPYSIADAARAGVREAVEWERTGVPPARPEYVRPPGFPLPKGWTPVGRRLSPISL